MGTLIAIDPGKTAGIATFKGNQLIGVELVKDPHSWLPRLACDVLIVETPIVGKHTKNPASIITLAFTVSVALAVVIIMVPVTVSIALPVVFVIAMVIVTVAMLTFVVIPVGVLVFLILLLFLVFFTFALEAGIVIGTFPGAVTGALLTAFGGKHL